MIDAVRRTPLVGLFVVLTLAAAFGCPPPRARRASPSRARTSTWCPARDGPGGDPFLQRQNEPSIAVSTRNPRTCSAGANDYRTVDIPGLERQREVGDAWLGVFKSFDGGQTWTEHAAPGLSAGHLRRGHCLAPQGLHTRRPTPCSAPAPTASSTTAASRSTATRTCGQRVRQRASSTRHRQREREAPTATTPTDPIRYVDTVVARHAARRASSSTSRGSRSTSRARARLRRRAAISGQRRPATSTWRTRSSRARTARAARSCFCARPTAARRGEADEDQPERTQEPGHERGDRPRDGGRLRRLPPVRDEQQQPGRDRRREVDGLRQDLQPGGRRARSSSPSTRTRPRPLASAPRAFPRSRCRSTRRDEPRPRRLGPARRAGRATRGSSSRPRSTASAGRRRR